jgi:hypothetical protein
VRYLIHAAILVCCLLGGAAPASAQQVEVGGRVGAGCIGSDGSLCGGGTSALFGAHAGFWFADRFEINVSGAHLGRESFTVHAADEPFPIDVAFTDRSRDFVSFVFVYHFMKDGPVRPMIGLGSGWYSDAERVACEPAGCAPHLRLGPRLGQYREWDLDAIFLVGLSSVLQERWVLRGGWQSHRFGNDENMTQEFFVGVGYRFGG